MTNEQIDRAAAVLHGQWSSGMTAVFHALHPELFDGSQAVYPHPVVKELLLKASTPFEHLDKADRDLRREQIRAILDATGPGREITRSESTGSSRIVVRIDLTKSRRSPEEQVKDLAEYVAGLLGPVMVRQEGHSQPPYVKDDPLHYQLDQGNDWFLNAELSPARDELRATIRHRYNIEGKVRAVHAMLTTFTGYEVGGNAVIYSYKEGA